MNYQKTVIVGNVGKTPELRYTNSGKAVCNFSVAVNEKYGETETTTWYKVVAWDKKAESAGKYLEKGQEVLVEGRVSVEAWADKVSGEPKATLVLTATSPIQFGSKSKMAGSEPEEMPF